MVFYGSFILANLETLFLSISLKIIPSQEKVSKIHNLIVIGGIFSLLTSFISLFLVLSQSKERFGVIDVGVLVALEAKEIVKSYPQGQLSPEKLERISKRLKEKVHVWGESHGVTLLAKGAVWGEKLPDYTGELLNEIDLSS